MPQPIDYTPTRYRAQRVSVRAAWSDAWLPVPHLWADRVEWTLSPAIPSAELSWTYGRGARQGETAIAAISPVDLVGYYVRIEVVGAATWYGVIQENNDDRRGSVLVDDDGESVRVPTGRQTLLAYGLEFLLSLETVTRSVIEGAGGDVTIERAIAFNASDGRGDQSAATGANCSAVVGSNGVRVFSSILSPGVSVPWLGGYIVAYLLEFFAPRNKANAAALPILLKLGDGSSALNYAVPTLDPAGLSLKDIFDRIIARRRGLAWRLVVEIDPDDGEELVKLDVTTFAKTRIVLANGAEIPPNGQQINFDVDFDADVVRFDNRESAVDQFDQVVARGARRGSVVTLSPADATIAADWSSTLEVEYEAAATTAPGYGSWSAVEKVSHHDDHRSADRFERVWSWYVLPPLWDGDVGDGEGGTKYRAFPTLDAAGLPTTTSATFWRPGLRFERLLPFLVGRDYSGSRIADDTVESTDPSTAQPEYRPPFVLLPARSGEWQFAERFDAASSAADSDRPHLWACNVAMRDDDAGFVLSVVGGRQHYLGAADFNANADDDTATFATQAVDWNDLVATVYVLSDEHVQARYPADADLGDGDVIRRRVIDVPDAFLDWVPAGTVVNRQVTGALDRVSVGGFVRDDRDRLSSIARAAWSWYGIARRKINAVIRGVRNDAPIGAFVLTAGGGEALIPNVNAVVTSVTLDLVANTTTIRTDHANLDEGVFG